MRWYGLFGALFVVLLAASPALAKMHDTSPPTIGSFVRIAVWITIFYGFFRRFMRGDRGPALFLSIAAVSVTVVAGIFVEASVKAVLGIPQEEHLSVRGQMVCLACVNLAFLTAVTATGAPKLFNQPFGALSFGKRAGFWIIALLPALYYVFYPRA